ncbi:MAG: hypothetical protein ACD_63C00136G0001, partial [uncultured bacterium]
KWHGLKDEEKRYRHRYLELLMSSDLKKNFIKKSQFWNEIREFLEQKDFLEVETPILENTPGGADANPFVTHHDALDIDLYLRISCGELWQKRLMVAGFEKTFEIGRVFRNEGIDTEHLQDYTMMECYWAYADFEKMMELVRKMYCAVIKKVFGTLKFKIRGFEIDFGKNWGCVDYIETVKKVVKVDILKSSNEDIEKKLNELGEKYEKGLSKGRLIDQLWKHCRKKIAGPAFLVNHPVEVSPLAKRNPENPKIVQRFQVIIGGSEMGNGYGELNDPDDQEKRFEEQAKLRDAGDVEAQMHDKDFVEALKHGMPPVAGFGVSERLFAFLADKSIRESVFFPLLKPEGGRNDDPKSIFPVFGVNKKTKGKTVKISMTRDEAFALLKENLKDEKNILHSRETEVIMRALARKLGEDEEFWGVVGLLHDLDWEKTQDNPSEHTNVTAKILKGKGFPPEGIRAIQTHNSEHAKGVERREKLDYAVACAESITGLIFASALVHPDKKLANVKAKSVKKKFKDRSFAAKVSREMIVECEKLGLGLEEFIELSLNAMREIDEEIGL